MIRRPDTEELDLDSVDQWAIDLVINEGIWMNLSYCEMIVAVRQLTDRGLSASEVAEKLRCTQVDVFNIKRRWSRLADIQRQRLSDQGATLHA